LDAEQYQFAKTLFFEARSLPREEWSAFLENRCQDPDVLEEVLSLLQQDGDSKGKLDQLNLKQEKPSQQDFEHSSEILRRLQSIAGGTGESRASRYEVLEEISRGGMGIIWKVRDRDMGRRLAMKTMQPGRKDRKPSAESGRMARFLEEAQVTAQLEHPGIVPVHEMGLDADGNVFFTMQLVRGQTLAEIFDVIRGGGDEWNSTRVLGVILRVCEAMAYAHDRRVIHRDLKPANIMVGRFGETYVMDWGLAKILGFSESHDLRIRPSRDHATVLTSVRKEESASAGGSDLRTMDGDVLGTPSYMPPEQARGEVDALGPHSDVYSVGAILYHLLTGYPPFEESGTRRPPIDVLQELARQAPVSVHLVAPQTPAELIAICERAMAREPAARYPSMLELAMDLRAYLENRVVRAYRTGAAAEFFKWIRRNRGLAALAGLVLVVTLGALGVISYVQTQARGELSSTNQKLGQANSQLQTANLELQNAKQETETALDRSEQVEAVTRWQSYVANISACVSNLRHGSPRDAAERLRACEPSLRQWEWQFLNNRVDTSIDLIEDASAAFTMAVQWSPDGALIVSSEGGFGSFAEDDAEIRIWDAETLDLLEAFPCGGGNANFLDLSPDGSLIACALKDVGVLVFDTTTGEIVLSHENPRPVAFHPNGRHVAVTWDTFTVYDVITGELFFEEHDKSHALRVIFSEDGKACAIGGRDGTVSLWNYPPTRRYWETDLTGAESLKSSGIQGTLDLDWAGDQRIVAGLDTGLVAVLDRETGQVLRRLTGHHRAVHAVAVSPHGGVVASASDDGTIRLWDLSNYTDLDVLYGHRGPVQAVEFSPDGRQLVSGSFDRTIRLWSSEPGGSTTRLRGTGWGSLGWYGDCSFDEKGQRLLWAPDRGTLRVSDARSGLPLLELPRADRDKGNLCGAAFVEAGTRIVTVFGQQRLRIWDAEIGSLVYASEEPLPNLYYADLDVARGRFAACATDGQKDRPRIQVRSLSSGELLQEWPVEALVWYVRFTPDGTRLVEGDLQGEVRVRDLESGEIRQRWSIPDRVHDIACWRNLVAAVNYDDRDHRVYLFDLESGKARAPLQGNAKPVVLDFLPDGSRIVTGNFDGSVGFWDLEKGEVSRIPAHSDVVLDVQFAPDGKSLVSFAVGAEHHIWHTSGPADREVARDHAVAERLREAEAEALIEPLFERYLIPAYVIRELRQMDSISESLRSSAIRLAALRPPLLRDEQTYTFVEDIFEQTYQQCVDPDASPDDYLRLQQIVHLLEAMAAEDSNRADAALALRGCIEYRVGRYRQAAEAWEECTRIWRTAKREGLRYFPGFFHALAQARLGNLDEAKELLQNARFRLRTTREELSPEARDARDDLQLEAEVLIQP
jgi:WD40 repeat protein